MSDRSRRSHLTTVGRDAPVEKRLRDLQAELDAVYRLLASEQYDAHEKVILMAGARAMQERGGEVPLRLIAQYAGCDLDEVDDVLRDLIGRWGENPPIVLFERAVGDD